jgi:hypothetical protein
MDGENNIPTRKRLTGTEFIMVMPNKQVVYHYDQHYFHCQCLHSETAQIGESDVTSHSPMSCTVLNLSARNVRQQGKLQNI